MVARHVREGVAPGGVPRPSEGEEGRRTLFCVPEHNGSIPIFIRNACGMTKVRLSKSIDEEESRFEEKKDAAPLACPPLQTHRIMQEHLIWLFCTLDFHL
jgi:hypothetical protein